VAAAVGEHVLLPPAGLPKGTEWFLYTPEGDVGVIRNWMAYSLWRRMGR
jgi:hypothetical protein